MNLKELKNLVQEVENSEKVVGGSGAAIGFNTTRKNPSHPLADLLEEDEAL